MLQKRLTTIQAIILSVFLTGFGFFISNHLNFLGLFVFADSQVFHISRVGGDGGDDKAESLAEEIEKLEKKIKDLQGAKKSLQNEISYFNNQISLAQLRIQSAISEIEKRTVILENLVEDISDLKFRINEMSDSIGYQEGVLSERMRTRYKTQNFSSVFLFLNSTNFSDVIRKIKYFKILQYEDQRLLDQMRKAKKAYNQQKNLFEEKKQQTEELKRKVEQEKANLVAYQQNLDNQKAAKQDLLEKTQNDESKFQQMLEDARRELSQIISAASALQGTKPKDVDEGDIIGIQGNTGYSFGDHLHFGVYRYDDIDDISGGWDWYNSNNVDPNDVLESKNVYWDTGCSLSRYKEYGDGDWEWPMSTPTVSQGYGHTCYSDTYYSGKNHPAIDMYGSIGEPIRAVADGKAYFCRNCLGDGGNGVFIFHDDGYMTLYWHLK